MSDTELSALEAAGSLEAVSPSSAVEEGNAFTTPEVLEGVSAMSDVTGPSGLGGAADGLGGAGGHVDEHGVHQTSTFERSHMTNTPKENESTQ